MTAYNIAHEGEWTRDATVYAENETFLSSEERLNRGLFSGYINNEGKIVSQYPPGVPWISAPVMLFSDLNSCLGIDNKPIDVCLPAPNQTPMVLSILQDNNHPPRGGNQFPQQCSYWIWYSFL